MLVFGKNKMISKTIKTHDELILEEYYVLTQLEKGMEDKFIIFKLKYMSDNWDKTSKDKDRVEGPYLGNFDGGCFKYLDHGLLWVTESRAVRPATLDEIEWLNTCRIANKYIPKEFVKNYFVELIIDKINEELNVNNDR